MSYVIQNFLRISPIFRLTYRKYFYWILRNNSRIILNIFYLNNINYTIGLNKNSASLIRFFFFKNAFNNSLMYYFSSRSTSWKPLLENSLVRSFEYWSFKKPLRLLLPDKLVIKGFIKPLSNNFFLNQNILEKRYSKMSIFNKTYKTIFNKFSLILLFNWKILRPAYNLFINVNLVNQDWLVLKRFNTTFFKVFFI